MTTPTKLCKCGKPANQLVIIKGAAYYLCEKHLQELEKFLGEKLEPLTNKYYERIPDYFLCFYEIKGYEPKEINL